MLSHSIQNQQDSIITHLELCRQVDILYVLEIQINICFYSCAQQFYQDLFKNLMKNQSIFISTGGSQLFGKSPPGSFRYDRKLGSYAHLPMKKEIPAWNTSSSVLQHSSSLYTIPKDKRFKQEKINYYNHLKLQYPSTLSNRATSFGYGRKMDIPKIFLNNKNTQTLETPFYEIDDMTLRRSKSASIKKGKTIGVNWNSYATARAPHRSTVHCPEQTRQNPGLKYDIATKTGQNAHSHLMHQKLMMFTQIRGHQTLNQPGPQNYLLNQKHVSKSSSKTNFGYGKKSDFTKNAQRSSVPGPMYNLGGFCDKFTVVRAKNTAKSWK